MTDQSSQDEIFIRICITDAEESSKQKRGPFAAIVSRGGEIISRSQNNSSSRISDHAEILALHEASLKLKDSDLTGCTLYSNCEPCPMCSFMAREYKVDRVVFSVVSPFVGGHSKWPIMQDKDLQKLDSFFSKAPKITGGILENEGIKVFKKLGWWMFGKNAKLPE